MGNIPDKFILLNIKSNVTVEKLKRNLTSEEQVIHYLPEQIDMLARNALTEYKINIEGVKEVCKGQIVEMDGNKAEAIVLEDIARMLKLNKSNGPRRPPRVVLLGPPGSGKQEIAEKIAQKYSLTYVKVSAMVKDYMRKEEEACGNLGEDRKKKQKVSQKVQELQHRIIHMGTFPDELVLQLVVERLSKPDCAVNGWILDGCPTSPEQIQRLKELNLAP
mmetsp:Transcript_22934/g.17382  ORF Transcript_22934/g.17382 Transcript_22934/m.17382 type:complete len:219 (+) Transcript_22934:358-1014(+)